MTDLDIKEFDTRVFENFDFNLCRDSLIDFSIEAIKAREHAFSVGLKHFDMYQDWLEQAIEGSYGSHLRYGSPATDRSLNFLPRLYSPVAFYRQTLSLV